MPKVPFMFCCQAMPNRNSQANQWLLSHTYLTDVLGGARANDSRVLGYDVMNEPHRQAPWTGGLAGFINASLHFIARTTRVPTTVDAYSQAPANLATIEAGLSIHSYWHYGHPQDCLSNGAAVRERRRLDSMHTAGVAPFILPLSVIVFTN